MSRMTIAEPRAPRLIEFNGHPEERAQAKAEFDKLMSSGMYFAYAVTVDKTSGKTENSQIKDFPEGTEEVEIVVTPRLVGG